MVIHSGSKYLNGHGDVLLGAVCGDEETIKQIGEREHYLRGNLLGPFEAWLALRGLRTFPLRMAHANRAGLEIAHFLENHPKVARVFYPLLPSHPQHELAVRQMRGAGSLLAFELKDGPGKVSPFINRLQHFKIAASWGSFEKLFQNPRFNIPIREVILMPQITINARRCKHCGICIAFCPKEVFGADHRGAPVVERAERCTACGLCVLRCPDFALEVGEQGK